MKISSIGAGFLSAALLCGSASAAETDYAAGARALPLTQAGGTARAMSMGSAVVGVSQGSASLLWNPAGLSRMSCTELGLHHNSGLAGIVQEIGIIGTPVGECKDDGKGGALGGIAASLGYVNYGSFSGRDALGLPAAGYHAGDLSGSAGWGIEVIPSLSAGIALKANRSDFADKTYDAFAADVGVLWAVLPSLDLGASYANFNLGKKIGESQLVQGWRLGAGWTASKHLLLAISGELQNKAMNRLQLGGEYLVGNIGNKINVLALRAGYQMNYPAPQLDGLTGLTVGLGYTLTRSIALDYAMLPVGELGASHRLSLTFKFDCPGKLEPAAAAAARKPAPYKERPYVSADTPPVVVKSILLEDSHFDFDKSELRPEGMAALRENIEILKDNPKALVRVAGYTSMSGTEEYNQRLSERRAAAVEKFLVAEGIKPGRITTIGFGETRPATHEVDPSQINTAAAQSNMRVLFEVTVK